MDSCNFFDNFKCADFILNNLLNPATIDLLKSSVLVAISGVFRVYIASLLLDTHVSMLLCLAGGFIIYSVYTLDRTFDSKEDNINHPELSNPCREFGVFASLSTLALGGYILYTKRLLTFVFLPFVIGVLYSKGIKIGKHSLKLKGGLGIKNFVVGLIWGVSVAGVAGAACKSIISLVIVFIFFEVKLYVNSVIYDFKDVAGDLKAGIKTLPVCIGEQKTRDFLLGLHLISHLLLSFGMIHGVIAFEPVIVVYSFICGLICIWEFSKIRRESESVKLRRTALIDGESAFIIGIRTISGFI